jgi:predicted ester cyclase
MSENLRILGQYSARMSAGDYGAVYDVFAPDFVSHVTGRVSPDAEGTDIRSQEHKFWETARSAFPDMKFRVDLLIESGDLIVSNWTLTGTHTGTAFYDVAPSGERVTINGTAILRMRDGKVVEHWGGPHCMYGIGLSPARTPHAAPSERAA